MKKKTNIFWFRRDFRLEDNTALFHALNSVNEVLPIFIFDKNILERLDSKTDHRVNFIYDTIQLLKTGLEKEGSSLKIMFGDPVECHQQLLEEFQVEALFYNRDYEPYALERDSQIEQLYKQKGAKTFSFKDHVFFEKNEVMKPDGTPYTVFTPYSVTWKKTFLQSGMENFPSEKLLNRFVKTRPFPSPTLKEIGFEPSLLKPFVSNFREDVVSVYHHHRDFPADSGTTKISLSLRFGLISIRKTVQKASALNEKYLNELIWRDFYQMILCHFPHTTHKCFKPRYDFIPWHNDEKEFALWCEGKTGYPLVDAGMRELNETGFMHNRVRMVVSSFLTKHLLIDWRWGEAYFAEKLFDFDKASNIGGWQWAAGCGVDAAPYFRIFNPYLQAKRFDPKQTYIKKWVPELNTLEYPLPMVSHEFARKRALQVFGAALK